jgi:hypothetical protein
MLLRFLGTSEGSEDVKAVLSVTEVQRKNDMDAEAWIGETVTERRCKAVDWRGYIVKLGLAIKMPVGPIPLPPPRQGYGADL